MSTVQTTEPILMDDDANRDILAVYAGDVAREVTDSTARTIASWWQSPGTVGRTLAALASGLPVDTTELLDDIHATRQESGYGTHTDLDCLATWVINYASSH
jgi:hypothetical protein